MTKKRPATPPDCLSCGACCVSLQDQEVFCDATPEDLEKFSKAWVKKNVIFTSTFDLLVRALDGRYEPWAALRTEWRTQKTGPLKGVDACACIALKGSIMDAVKCSIYEKRPRVCHVAVVPGDRTCLDLRRMFADAIEENRERLEAESAR